MVAVTTVLLLAVLSLIAAMSAQATNQAPARTAQGLTQVIVRPGQSLWSVAENADPAADTRVVVQQIVHLNGLTGSPSSRASGCGSRAADHRDTPAARPTGPPASGSGLTARFLLPAVVLVVYRNHNI